MSNSENKGKTRKILSLKSTAGVQPVSSSYGSRTVDVEVKKRRSGLAIDVTKSLKGRHTVDIHKEDEYQSGKLTDKEFKARVKALQEAIKEEQEEQEQHEEQLIQDDFESNKPEEPVSAQQEPEPEATPKADANRRLNPKRKRRMNQPPIPSSSKQRNIPNNPHLLKNKTLKRSKISQLRKTPNQSS